MKDLFLKKLQICMKTYDYADETKDVKGKVSRFISRAKELTPSLNFKVCFKNKRA